MVTANKSGAIPLKDRPKLPRDRWSNGKAVVDEKMSVYIK
jgi:hypothetical protein